MVGWVCSRFVNDKTMGLNSVGERAYKCGKEIREWRWRHIKPIDRWYLELTAKCLHCIICSNTWITNCATF